MIEEGSAVLFSPHSNIKCVCGRFISISIILYCNKLLAPNKMCECVSLFYVYLCLYSSIFIYLYSSFLIIYIIFIPFPFFFSFFHIQFQMWLCRSDVMDGLLVLWLSLVTVVSLVREKKFFISFPSSGDNEGRKTKEWKILYLNKFFYSYTFVGWKLRGSSGIFADILEMKNEQMRKYVYCNISSEIKMQIFLLELNYVSKNFVKMKIMNSDTHTNNHLSVYFE